MSSSNRIPTSFTNLVQNKISFQSLQNGNNDSSRCRICLESNSPLVQLPCSCVGEAGLIHQSCFSEWIKTIKDETSPLSRQGQNIKKTSNDSYQIPCEICKNKIQFQMIKKKQCINCKDLKRPQSLFSIFCVVFNLAIIGVVSFLCIGSIVNNNTSNTGVKLFVNLSILIIVYVTFGWLIKRQLKFMFKIKITNLKIIQRKNHLGQIEQAHNDQQSGQKQTDKHINIQSRQNHENRYL